MCSLVLGNRLLRRHPAQGTAIAFLGALDQVEGFGEEVARVHVEDVYVRVDAQGDVHQCHTTGPKGGADGKSRAKIGDGPGQNILGGGAFKATAQAGEKGVLPGVKGLVLGEKCAGNAHCCRFLRFAVR